MAKKVEIDIIVNGQMTKATVDAKKLRGQLDNLDTSQEKATKSGDRFQKGLKGLGEQSANSTKNFAKFSSGMGGLVGAYASLAAQTFALSAAFNFLKSAGDLAVLEQGQKAYATSTGVALRVLAEDIIKASDAQITFRDASQAAAIGTAAGLTADQLSKLGKAAKDTSLILGRDVTDSFNRLVRGVTKAEPELLDELGIILRLKSATEDYALTIGKTADELTAYERSQAVALDVIEQVDSKYSIFVENFDASTNTYVKLGKAIDDLLNDIKRATDFIVGPFATALTNAPLVALTGFALLLKGPLAAIGLNLNQIAVDANRSAQVYKRAAGIKAAAAKRMALTQEEATAAVRRQSAAILELQGSTASSVLLRDMASGAKLTKTSFATLNRAVDAALKKTQAGARVTSGIFKGMTREMVADYKLALAQMETAEKLKVTQTQKNTAAMRASWAALGASIRGGAASLFSFGLRLFNIVGIASLVYTALEAMGVPLTKFLKGVFTTPPDPTKTFGIDSERLQMLNEEFSEVEKKIMEFVRKNPGAAAANGFAILGNMIRSLPTDEFDAFVKSLPEIRKMEKVKTILPSDILDPEKQKYLEKLLPAQLDALKRGERVELKVRAPGLDETQKKIKKFYESQVEVFQRLQDQAPSPIFENYIRLLEQARSSDVISEEQLIALRGAKVAAEDLGLTIQNLPRVLGEAGQAFNGFLQRISPLSDGEKTLQSLRKALEDLAKKSIDGGGLDSDELEQYGELTEQVLFVENIEKRRVAVQQEINRVALENLEAVNESNRFTKAQVSLESQIRTNTAQQFAEKSKILEVNDKILQNNGKMSDADRRAIIAAAQKWNILQLQTEELQEQLDLEKSIAPIRERLFDNQTSGKLLNAQNLMNNAVAKEAQLRKQIFDTQMKLARDAITEAAEDVAVSNPFFDKQRFVAEEMLKLEEETYARRLNQINQEYVIKLQSIDAEYSMLDLRREQTMLELQKLALELDAEGKKEQALRAAKMAAKVAGVSYAGAKEAAIEMAGATREAALFDLDKGVRSARRVVKELQPLNQLMKTAADSFETAINDSIDAIFASYADKTMDLQEKLKDIGRNLLLSIQKAFTRKFVVEPLLDLLGLGAADQASKIAKAHSEGSTEVATKLNTTFATGASQMQIAITQALTSNKIKVCCCDPKDSSDPVAIVEALRNASFIIGGGFGGGINGGISEEERRNREMDAVVIAEGGTPPGQAATAAANGFFSTFSEWLLGTKEDIVTLIEAGTGLGEIGDKLIIGQDITGAQAGNLYTAGVGEITEGASVGGFLNKIGDIFNSFSASLGKFFGVENSPFLKGFGDVLKGVMSNLGGFLKSGIDMLINGIGKVLGSLSSGAGGGSWITTIMSMFGYKDGGISNNGSKVTGYATGGIAKGPKSGHLAMLHGREAVVPLPNGNKIPVDMKGAGDVQTNNVSVSVNIASDGQSETSVNSEQGGLDLGKVISQAVTAELQKQKRPGGILSPLGAA